MVAGQDVSSAQAEQEEGEKSPLPQIGFYHLTRTSVQEALPQLLDRTLASGERAVISCASDEEMKNLDRTLWESRHYFWLPHGAEGNSDEESHAVRQPIWLSVRTEAPANGARFLFRLNGAPTAPLAGFVRIFDLFNGQDEQSVAEARKRWKEFRQAGYSLAYWKQEAKGWRQAG